MKNLIIIPLIVAMGVLLIHQMVHVGIDGLIILDWYEEKPFEPAPIKEFIT